MITELKIPNQPTPVGEMLTEEFLAPLMIGQGGASKGYGREP